ncbi:hypothetical protein VDG1235_3603 [Verrucomicrobiia bacterium DG1235]|nr:hypothetical protein VDG1235_3603 [Verrucomicrobiae bacterium DG1235]
MAFMDGELSAAEMAEVNDRLMRDASLRDEYESLRSACGKLERVGMDMPDEEALKKLWRSPFNVVASGLAIWLIGVGLAVLAIYAVAGLLASSHEVTVAGLAVGAVVVGFLILLIVKVRERVKSLPDDPYKDIEK